jgi:hypothetical protein
MTVCKFGQTKVVTGKIAGTKELGNKFCEFRRTKAGNLDAYEPYMTNISIEINTYVGEVAYLPILRRSHAATAGPNPISASFQRAALRLPA